MNDIANTAETLTPEQVAALMANLHETSEGETAPTEATVFVTEDTADHALTIH